MVPQPSTERVGSALTRRQFLAAGVAGAALAGVPVASAQSNPEPPGVVQRRTYENLRITGTAEAHGEGRVLVGREWPRPGPDDPVRVALTDAGGAVRQRASFTPELPEGSHAAPDVVRTDDGYAVAAGPWLARLGPDLSLRATGKHAGDIGAARGTTLVAVDGGFVAGFTDWLPNAFWTWLVAFDAEGQYRWHREVNDNGSQALDFLVPASDGGVLAGGTFPWLAAFDADGSSRRIDLPADRPDGVLNAGVGDGDGLILCSGNAAARLDASYELDWTREYGPLGDEQVGEITSTSDGGFLFHTTPVGDGDFTLAKADAEGELQWHHTYRIGTDTPSEIHALTERSSGEYLLAGGANRSSDGWALAFSEAETPTPAPTVTPTATPTETATSAPSSRPTRSESPPTTTTGPGFGLLAGGVAAVGTIAAALRGTRD
ncbi:hypothetical protein [Halolamina salina]